MGIKNVAFDLGNFLKKKVGKSLQEVLGDDLISTSEIIGDAVFELIKMIESDINTDFQKQVKKNKIVVSNTNARLNFLQRMIAIILKKYYIDETIMTLFSTDIQSFSDEDILSFVTNNVRNTLRDLANDTWVTGTAYVSNSRNSYTNDEILESVMM